MESIEVWMWVVAGLIVGGIVFAGSYMLLGNYMRNLEASQAEDSFSRLSTSASKVCTSGNSARELIELSFPRSTAKVYASDDELSEDSGHKLCLQMQGEFAGCVSTGQCTMTMETVVPGRPSGIFYYLEKAIGRMKPMMYKFTVVKATLGIVNITWEEIYQPG